MALPHYFGQWLIQATACATVQTVILVVSLRSLILNDACIHGNKIISDVGPLFMQPIKPRSASLEHIIHVEMVNTNPNPSPNPKPKDVERS